MKFVRRFVVVAPLLVIAGLAIAWFAGVFDKKIYPGAPQEPPVAHSSYFDDIQSTFAVPVTTTIAAAEQYAKSKIPDPISFKRENFHIGPIFVISLDGGAHIINFHAKKADNPADSITVDADFNGHGTFSPQIVLLKPHFGFDFNGHLTLTASAAIDAKWSVTPKYQLAVNISKIDLNHVGDVTGLFRGMFEDQIKNNAHDVIGKAIADGSAEVKRVAAQAWNALRVSQEVTKTPPVWLNIEPMELSMSPLSVTADQLGIRVGVSAKTRAYIDESPPALTAKDLPGLVINPNLPNRYNIVVPIEVSLDQLTAPLNQALNGKDFESDGVRVSVSNAQTTGSGDSILLRFDFKASRGQFLPGARGTLYARGHVHFDQAKQSLSISDLDYTVETAALLQIANWILKPNILKTVSEQAKLQAEPILASAKTDAEKKIASIETPKGIKSWKLTIDKPITLVDVRVVNGRLYALVRVEGVTALAL